MAAYCVLTIGFTFGSLLIVSPLLAGFQVDLSFRACAFVLPFALGWGLISSVLVLFLSLAFRQSDRNQVVVIVATLCSFVSAAILAYFMRVIADC